MKLIDILVQELPKRGGWPEGIEEIWQDYDGLIRPGAFGWNHDQIAEDHRRKHEDAHVKINRKQYEAALEASKPEWDGEGLPQVGTECEIKRAADWMPVTIKFISEQHTIFTTFGGTEDCYQTFSLQFRPILSESDKKRNLAVNEMIEVYRNALGSTFNAMEELYDAIAAGKIPGIRVE